LQELSRQFGVTQQRIREYNKWLKSSKVPEDATFPILIPLTHQQYAEIDVVGVQDILSKYKIRYTDYWDSAKAFPKISDNKARLGKKAILVTLFNDIPGVMAQAGDHLESLAQKGAIPLKQFLELNEIDLTHRLKVGQVYYFKAKKSKAGVHYHIARPGETWWSVAQKYGITKSALLSKNRLRKESALQVGRVLWLRFIRPANIPIAYEQEPVKVCNN
jgi:membrane-bound lytic murein transglycosylase D